MDQKLYVSIKEAAFRDELEKVALSMEELSYIGAWALSKVLPPLAFGAGVATAGGLVGGALANTNKTNRDTGFFDKHPVLSGAISSGIIPISMALNRATREKTSSLNKVAAKLGLSKTTFSESQLHSMYTALTGKNLRGSKKFVNKLRNKVDSKTKK